MADTVTNLSNINVYKSIDDYNADTHNDTSILNLVEIDLADVATSGSFNDLLNKPTIDSALSTSSTNAVQNKTIAPILNGLENNYMQRTLILTGDLNLINRTTANDTYRAQGRFYYTDSLASKSNIPSDTICSDSTSYGTVFTYNTDSSNGFQILYAGNYSSTSSVKNFGTFTRSLKSGTWSDWSKFGGGGSGASMYYGTCSTDASTTTKVVSLSDTSFTLTSGVEVIVNFLNNNTINTSTATTLNVNSTGAKNINYRSAVLNENYNIVAGDVITFLYDGSVWRIVGVLVPTYGDADSTSY